jgi:hypothetical protein
VRTPTVRVPPWRWWNFTTENGSAKGARLSGTTARSEYGLTRDEIFVAIDAGKLQYGPRAMHGKRWLRLLRREIEDLAMSLHGDPDLPEQQPRTERAQVNRELQQIPNAAAGTPCSMIRPPGCVFLCCGHSRSTPISGVRQFGEYAATGLAPVARRYLPA